MLKRLLKWAFEFELSLLREDAQKTIEAYRVLNDDLEKQNEALKKQMLDYRIMKMYVNDDAAILELLDAERKREESEKQTNASADYWRKRAESAENELMTWSSSPGYGARQLAAMQNVAVIRNQAMQNAAMGAACGLGALGQGSAYVRGPQ